MADTFEIDQLPDFSLNPVILVSGEAPGCGATTVARMISERVEENTGRPTHVRFVGQMIRDELGVKKEEDFGDLLKMVEDPSQFDPKIYGDLPTDQPCVVEGKLATVAGPRYVRGNRPVISIDLEVPTLFSAKRILQREGEIVPDMVASADVGSALLDKLRTIQIRAEHDRKMKEAFCEQGVVEVPTFRIDTSEVTSDEVAALIAGGVDLCESKGGADWEIRLVTEALKSITSLGIDLHDEMHVRDVEHHGHHLAAVRYSLERLKTTVNPIGREAIREDLRKYLCDGWFALMMRKTVRFYRHVEDESIACDTTSTNWSPEFYKIAEGWPTISRMLEGSTVLDPYAGSGSMAHFLIAREVPKSVTCADLCYRGGPSLEGTQNWYDPELNSQALRMFFDDLPSWYKPSSSGIEYRQADSKALPYGTNSFDYVFTDPPYGKNHSRAGLGLFMGSIDEFIRVSRKGSIFLVPTDWVGTLRESGRVVDVLTEDVSHGKSGLPTCYIYIDNEKNRKK